MSEIYFIAKYYKLESWWLGVKKHINQKYYNVFALNGFDVTLQWSKSHIDSTNFKMFKEKLFRIVHQNKCKIYLTQDIMSSSKDISKIYKFINLELNKKDNIFSSLLKDRILGNK